MKLEKFTPGKHQTDFEAASAEAKRLDPNFIEPDGYTWHHHQDGTTMQLVPRDLHYAFRHTGGMATTKHGKKIE